MGQNVGSRNYLEQFGKSTLILVKSYPKNQFKTFTKKNKKKQNIDLKKIYPL